MVEAVRVNLQREFESPEARANPIPVYAKLRKLGPVLHSTALYGEGFVLPRYEEVVSVLKDPRFANDRRNVPGGTSMDRWWMPAILRLLVSSMVLKDPPDHRRLRNLVQKAFTPIMVENLNGRVEQITEELLDAAVRKPVVDLMEEFALPLPLTVISEMLGVPEPDRINFRKLIAKVLDPSSVSPIAFIRNYPHMLRLNRFLRRLVNLRREQPGNDLVTALVQAEEGGDRLSEDELISMIFLLLFAGHETTVNLIGNGVLALVRHPDQLQKLREQPDLIDSAIEEMLRFTNPVGQVAPRFAKEDVEIAGVRIPKGSAVTLLIASANLDETAFPNADKLDITRSPNRHVSFGYGIHYCLGAPLARLEARVAIPALLQRFPRLELAVPAEKLRWRPNIGLRGLEALPLSVSPASSAAERSAA
ncbi:putative cytochrome P450 hydroxylase [Cystobacter fuscus]|uniref:Putative cytochrome P450 hydroxylase n=1 Tax=Cystobacter fuscus TaxID=43 RepID=A0A250J8S5_9BACT|nr:cytochrome P450 [Cystobacter fuscus]ATB39831.1 putative cytochrome P450 hydroxylase [Cystobacter fuscus]